MKILTQDEFLAEAPPFGGRLRADGRVDVYESAAERPAPTPPRRLIDKADFRDRFSAGELTAITSLAYSGAGDALARVLLLRLTTTRDGIDLDNPDVIAGLDHLIAKGALAAPRKAEILA